MNTRANEGRSAHLDALWQIMRPHVKHRVWLFSDLQQSDPANARSCMETALSDFTALGWQAEQIWYLGDSVQGKDMAHLRAMAEMQEEGFGSLGIPLCYVTGNHDYDWSNANRAEKPILPFWEKVCAHDGWRTTEDLEQIYFTHKLGRYTVFFFSDHIARDNRWLVTHGSIRYGGEHYPYTEADAEAIRAAMAAVDGPIITASHYAYHGGNRGSDLLSRLLPLPNQVRLHVYGHSHIGDFRWGAENAYRRIAWVNWHDIPQIDVSSLENIRAEFCRSVFFEIYDDDSFGLFFRDHDHRCFTEAYFPSRENFMPKADKFAKEEAAL
ncbi:MAG: metallophosphoesterase [Clostridia bacterium]|nr:metallophosphoesterase [Clostridia bacterium]